MVRLICHLWRLFIDGWSNLLDEHETRTTAADLCPDEVEVAP